MESQLAQLSEQLSNLQSQLSDHIDKSNDNFENVRKEVDRKLGSGLAHGVDRESDLLRDRGSRSRTDAQRIAGAFASSKQGPSEDNPTHSCEVFEEFVAIKDSLSRCKLPADLKFGPNINGIRSEDKGAYRVIKTVASYCETNLKILSLMQNDEYRSDQGALNDLVISNTALMKTLKEEHATLMVQGKFNKDTAFMYKALGTDSNSFSVNSLERLQLAANLTQYNLVVR